MGYDDLGGGGMSPPEVIERFNEEAPRLFLALDVPDDKVGAVSNERGRNLGEAPLEGSDRIVRTHNGWWCKYVITTRNGDKVPITMELRKLATLSVPAGSIGIDGKVWLQPEGDFDVYAKEVDALLRKKSPRS